MGGRGVNSGINSNRRNQPRTLGDWWNELARHDPTRLLNDVFVRPSIGPFAAWLIGALIALVGWLTIHYASGAVARAGAIPGADRAGVIPVSTGYWTIAFVAVLTLAAGMQPLIERRVEEIQAGMLSPWFARQPLWVRWPVEVIGGALRAVYAVPSVVLSLADYLLARPIATLSGTRLQPFWLRYGVLMLWLAASTATAWRAPAPWGLYAFFAGVAAVVGVVRRWSWVERDRESFFVSRKADPDGERVGFAEDLRDEALVAIAFLLILIPLGLRQVDLNYPGTFSENHGAVDDTSILAWFGFFGAELAKAVPFVDWSEVFYVANGSPIEPHTVLGAQVVFAMRATLDLLMLAAVTQAVQIGSRLAEQKAAFAEGKVDILEPFVERARLRTVGAILTKDRGWRVLDHPALAAFPTYSPERLHQIAHGIGPRGQRPVQALADPVARRAALALAMRQLSREEARPLVINAALHDPYDDNRAFALRIAQESEPTALMAVAFSRAQDMQTRDAAALEQLLATFPEPTRPLALRAIQSAFGELDQMVVIPAGSFMMGADEGEVGASKTERPKHEVVIAQPFEIGKYPVTFDEYEAFCDATGHDRTTDSGWGVGRRPVIYVNWHDAVAYIAWLNAWTGERFRLPSEAEWEYVCRAGTTTRFFCGDDSACLADHAWSDANSQNQSHPVGEKQANAFGVYDMHGLVWEWCEDAWTANYEGAPSDGTPWLAGDPSLRVLRGGSWYNAYQLLGSADRHWNDITLRDPRNGFRLAKSV